MAEIKQDVKIEKLRGSENYQKWAASMKGMLSAYGLFKYAVQTQGGRAEDRPRVTADETIDEDRYDKQVAKQDTWDNNQAKASWLIFNNVSDSIAITLDNDLYQTAASRWEYLKRYAQSGYTDMMEALATFWVLNAKGRSIEDYCIRFEQAANKLDQLRSSDKPKLIADEAKIGFFLQSMSDTILDQWAARKRSEFQAMEDPSRVTLNDLMKQAIEESRIVVKRKTGNKADALGLATDSGKRNNSNGNGGNDFHQQSPRPGQKCFACDSPHHLKTNCHYIHPENAPGHWTPKLQIGKFVDADLSKGNTFKRKDGSKSGKGKKGDGDATAVATLTDSSALTAHRANDWVVDSGATDHMCNDWNMFEDVRPCNVTVRTAKGNLAAVNIGTVRVNALDSSGNVCKLMLLNVLYLPHLFVNLLSTHKLADHGLSVHTAENQVVWKGSNDEVFSLIDTGRQWIVNLDHEPEALLSSAELWHSRLGHASYEYIQKTAKQVTGIGSIAKPAEQCQACAQGKAEHHDSKVGHRRSERFADLLHLDLVGPVTPEASNEENTILNITDDATRARYTRIFRGKEAPTVLAAFKQFEQTVQLQLNISVKGLKMDGGTEFSALINYALGKGIRVDVVPAYTPAKNGVAERTNGLIHNKVRSMLFGGNVPLAYWDEAYRAAVHIVNRTSTSTLSGKTPYQAVNEALGKDRDAPDVSHLRAYGCKAFVTVPNARRHGGKFGPRAYIGKLVGYGLDSTVYRVLVPSRGGVIETSHVRFDETRFDSVNDIIKSSKDPEDNSVDEDDQVNNRIGMPPILLREPLNNDSNDSTFLSPLSRSPTVSTEPEDRRVNIDLKSDSTGDSTGIRVTQSIEPEPVTYDDKAVDDMDSPEREIATEGLLDRFKAVRGNRQQQFDEGDAEDGVISSVEPHQDMNVVSRPSALDRERYFSSPSSVDSSPARFVPTGNRGREKSSLSPLPASSTERATVQYPSLAPSNLDLPTSESNPPAHRYPTRSRDMPGTFLEGPNTHFAEAFSAASEVGGRPKEPTTYQQAMAYDPAQWNKAIAEELASQEANGTFVWGVPPPDKKVLRTKWVFKLKTDDQGRVIRYKARVVAKGFLQKPGIDFTETFAAVAKTNTFRVFMALVATDDLVCHQMDAVTAFLNPYLPEDVELWMEPPEGVSPPQSGMKWLLKRTLYGLKQSAREWYQDAARSLINLGFKRSESDHCLFFRGKTWVLVYVDDFLIAAPTLREVNKIKKQLSNRYKMKDMGELKYFLGIKVERNRRNRSVKLTQTAYLEHMLEELGMAGAKPRDSPLAEGMIIEAPPTDHKAPEELLSWYQRACGFLMYAAMITRADIACVVSQLCRYMSNPTESHRTAIKSVLRYVKGSLAYGVDITFKNDASGELAILGWSDSAYADDSETRRSHAGYVFTVGTARKAPITWQSGLQRIVTLSSTEAELVALTTATQEAMWLTRLLEEFGRNEGPITIMEDNTSTIALTKNPEHHKGTKHIEVRHYFCREQLLGGKIKVDYVATNENIADGLTKALGVNKHKDFVKMLGMD